MSKVFQARLKSNPLYYDSLFRLVRTSVLRRDRYRCVHCFFPYKLTAHHIRPKDSYPEFICCDWNMVTLCQRCHHSAHKGVKGFEKFIHRGNPTREEVLSYDWLPKGFLVTL